MAKGVKPLPPDDYAGPVLPGQRWRNRGVAGHGMDLCTVLRFNGRSVQVMYEGQRDGGSAHKAGHRYGVPLATFRRNYVLERQAPGYKPEIEVTVTEVEVTVVPAPLPPVERYFRKHRRVDEVMGVLEGTDVRFAVSQPVYAHLMPPNPLDVLAAAEAAVRKLSPEEENPPVQTTAAPAEPPTASNTVPDEEWQSRADEPAPDVIPAVVLLPEADPLDAFLENGRALVRGLDAEVASLATEHDRLMRLVNEVEDKLREASRRRDRISAGVDAAIAAALGVPEEEEAPPAPPAPVAHQTEPVRVVDNGKRLMGPAGFVARPGKVSQREWVLDRFAQAGSITIQAIVTEFGEYFGIPREQAIKNVSSLMGAQMKQPNPRWPVPVRTGVGAYGVQGG